jgi:hypothetical protein
MADRADRGQSKRYYAKRSFPHLVGDASLREPHQLGKRGIRPIDPWVLLLLVWLKGNACQD